MNKQAGQIALRRLKVKAGDIVTITFPASYTVAKMNQIMTVLTPLAMHMQITIIGLQPGVSLASLDEQKMNSIGWYRK